RYVDSLWSADDSSLQAQSTAQGIRIERTGAPLTLSENGYPLLMGEQTYGNLHLPDCTRLTTEQDACLQALLREMSNALHNAQLLQNTRAYSTQLQVAAEVSRAVTTVLDRDDLIRSVVSLIQN